MFPYLDDYREIDRPRVSAFRQSVTSVVTKLDHSKLIYIPAVPLMPAHTGLTIDGVHPSPDSMEQIASALAQQLSNYSALSK